MIFCVEDDSSIRELMVYTLNASGMQAMGFEEGGSFFEALKTEKPQLIMLDIMLPGTDGIEILRRLKADRSTADIPVIMATAKGTEYDKVIGLDIGADDYLVKPFGMMEMVSRIKAVLRRCEPKNDNAVLKVGALVLDPLGHTVTSCGNKVQLTLKEFELLALFMKNPGRAFTRESLLSVIWGSDYLGETRTVDVHIGTLRTKLGTCGEYIQTVRGVGYRINSD